LERLPDGIRKSKASHIIIELKYSQSLNDDTYCQVGGYYKFYKESNKLKDSEIDAFIISSKTPSKKFINDFGYKKKVAPGVFLSSYPVVRIIPLISLNDLSNAPYNIPFKIFASKKREQISVYNKIKNMLKKKIFTKELNRFFYSFFKVLFIKGVEEMDWLNLSPEEEQKIISSFDDVILERMSIEKRLKGIKPEDRLKGIKAEDRLKGIKPEDIEIIEFYLNKLKIKDIN